jgi:predicted enzyme related to lactoylglutathione lyase
MTANPVNWFEIYVQNTTRAKAFYEAVFKVSLEKLAAPGPGINEMWMFPSEQKAPGAAGALVKMGRRSVQRQQRHRLLFLRRLRRRSEARSGCRRQDQEGQVLDRPVRLHRARR